MNANALKFTQITLSLPKYTQKIRNSKVCSQFRLIIFVPEHFVNTLRHKKDGCELLHNRLYSL